MVDVAKDKYPIYIGELGWGDWINPPVENHPTWFPKTFSWIDNNQYSWSGWSMHPGGGPAIITDWTYATVTESNGKYIRDRLTSYPSGSDTQAPTAPTGLWNTSKSSTTMNWAWNASTDNVGVTAYELFVNGETTPRVTTASTTAALTGLSANTSYSVRVRAKDAAGNVSALSTNVVVTTNASGRIASANAAAAPGPEILAYPNPVTATLRIKVKDLEQATLVNLNGQHVFTTRSDVMDVTHLPPGVYLLKVRTKNQNRVVRITKQ
jgi:hypothetical protein